MYILGLSSYAHEAACALIRDGRLVVLFEEERLNREKHTCQYPLNAIEECLQWEGITIKDIDHITFFWQPMREVLGNIGHVIQFFPQSLNLLKVPSSGNELSFFPRCQAMRSIGRRIQQHFELSHPPQVTFIEHHLCHAGSTFFVSPFEEAAILTIDGRGESTCTLMAVGQGNKIEKLKEIKVPHSLGHLYAAITDYLGFKAFFDEWKVMGMSAYGKDTLAEDFEPLVALSPGGGYRLNLDYFQFHTHGQKAWVSNRFIKKFGPQRQPGEAYEQRHYDLAYALQRVIEKTGVHLARELYQRTTLKALCLSGGVVLNCLMNKKIIEQTPFEQFFFQPIANDAGTSFGSALYYYHQVLNQRRTYQFDSVYLGGEFSDEEIERALTARNLKFRKSGHIALETARHIAQGKIVGWFQGRMEAGPRALGNRSITVSPLDARMKERLNARVKKREFFRPFAPSVLEEKSDQYFLIPKGQLSPYMILTGEVRPEKRSVIPAVTHADGTARVHTVNRLINPRYWELISEFEKITGVPVLLNTSFNENEPIVCNPEQAVDCFLRTQFDVLAIGDYLVEK